MTWGRGLGVIWVAPRLWLVSLVACAVGEAPSTPGSWGLGARATA
eukprot:CAMPEP_0183346164 /NCGR_PEP_ID=MMETSP0164_2-20130417/11362_1 /TAXON_ID=221442 /ORGANISM="Coccolithus pelagicus ssp braarudi, Strain PLY182g" /LENGTH=44 /DNA_ID= /DNA_START= /DNA_END= /DNA_ORIENTATION=